MRLDHLLSMEYIQCESIVYDEVDAHSLRLMFGFEGSRLQIVP